MPEYYGVSSSDYLDRAKALLKSGKKQELIYAALELRGGTEIRMKEYLEAQKHISAKKKKGWQVSKLGRNIEKAFRLGDRIAEITVTEIETGEPIAVLYYTPVKNKLRENVEKLGNYLHAINAKDTSDPEWWNNFRILLGETAKYLEEATRGVLLGPAIMDKKRKSVYMSMSGFNKKEMDYLMKKMAPKERIMTKIAYLDSLPPSAKSHVFIKRE